MNTEIVNLIGTDVKIPTVFGEIVPDIRDYIAYIRLKYPDPWTRIYLKTDLLNNTSELLHSANIYCFETDNDLQTLREHEQEVLFGIDTAFLIITKKLLQDNMPKNKDISDALISIINSFKQNVNVQRFDVLLYFEDMLNEDIEILNGIHDTAIMHYSSSDIYFIYPRKFGDYLRIDTKNIDIVHHIDAIRKARHIGNFKLDMLNELELFVKEEQAAGKNKITYSGFEGFADLRYIVSYLYLKYKIEFVYPYSLLTWLTDSEYIYLYNRLSLFERLKFVQSLPEAFCYDIKKSYKQVDCRMRSYSTPKVIAVYDFSTCEEVSLSVDWENDIFVDFRELFIDKTPIISDITVNVDFKSFKDFDTDKMLVDKFIKMDISKYITIKNSILLNRDNTLYLVHTKGDFSVETILQVQNVIQNLPFNIEEVNFHRIYTHPIFKEVVGDVKPAYSIDVRLLSFLFNNNPSMLSYYERSLRWCRILEEENIDIFKEIKLETIRKEPTSRYFISCFGNPLNFSKQSKTNVVMRVTNKIMEGKRLP